MPFTYDLSRLPDANGAQGNIYFGTRSDGLSVAVKVAAPRKSAVEALNKEIALLRTLEEAGVSGIVRCIDAIELDDQPAMVMPRYERTLGVWLMASLKEPAAHTLEEVLVYTAALARTLDAVHAVQMEGHSLVHRDVKPENIFVGEDGSLYLGDFGGAMTIDGLQHVELALFGTPMWAPLDQILPGITIPDPTWDTYALCVLLFACFTGARPAYQADPRELLTPEGAELWELARQAILAEGEPRKTLRRDFAKQRQQAKAADLVDFTGRAALNDADRAALDAGVERLGRLAGVGEERIIRLQRALWTLLVRGLSPLSHPSPPNRFRHGEELAVALDDLRETLHVETTASLPATPAPAEPRRDVFSGPMDGPDIELSNDLDSRDLPGGALSPSPMLYVALGGTALVLLTAIAWLLAGLLSSVPRQEMVLVPASDGVSSFLLDRTEVTASGYQRCVASGECATATTSSGAEPATGVPFEDALAYCAFRGGRLPTEAEWLAAIGPDTWPWGEAEPTCAHATAADCNSPPRPAGLTPDGASAQGIVDLAGNTWEWTIAADETGVLMGGSARSPRSQIGRSGRWPSSGAETPPLAGLRCAYDAD